MEDFRRALGSMPVADLGRGEKSGFLVHDVSHTHITSLIGPKHTHTAMHNTEQDSLDNLVGSVATALAQTTSYKSFPVLTENGD